MDNMRLDLSGVASSFIQQLERVQQAIIDKVMHLIDERLSNGQSQTTQTTNLICPGTLQHLHQLLRQLGTAQSSQQLPHPLT
jgi:hypothetical protein